MDAEHFSRLETLFQQALKLSASEREAWIDDKCQPELAAELRQLLAANATTESDPVREVVARAFGAAGNTMIGQTIDGYRIIAEIGQGGMGTVYEAVRTEVDFEQHVAIKLLRLGLRDEVSLARFKRERQLLAHLSHPNIASLIDGGTTADGTPWVVMELVHGHSLLQHADQQDLNLRQRISLFIKLCRAIAFAHRSLVVHRDLKPENVIVNAEGEPKVLDFGIARLLDESNDAVATLIQAYTPTYASPEQVLGAPVSLACDVYSLAVILFELLTGALPYNTSDDGNNNWQTLICEQQPSRPSSYKPRLRGDLDHIILMALRKDPQRRYASASELADDLERYLAARPVVASPDKLGYRLGKYLQRHPLGVSAAGIIAILTVAFLSNTLIQSKRLAAERDRALQEATIAGESTDFLISLFQTPDPKELEQADLSATDLLDRGAKRIGELKSATPLVKARLMQVMGLAYTNLGRFDEGIDLLQQALSLRLDASGKESADSADSRNRLGNALRAAGHYRQAEPHLVAALAYRLDSGEGDKVDLADSLNNVGLLQLDLARYKDAASNLEAAIAMHRRLDGNNLAVAVAMHNLALVRLGQARPQDAITILDSALKIKRGHDMAKRSTYANSQAVLARALLTSGQLDQALTMAENSLELRREILPTGHHQIASGITTLAAVLAAQKYDEPALAGFEEAISIAEQTYGPGAWRSLRYKSNRAKMLELDGKTLAAVVIYKEIMGAARVEFDSESLHIARAATDLGRALLQAGQIESARPLISEALEIKQMLLTPDHPSVIEAKWLGNMAADGSATMPAVLQTDMRLGFRLLRKLAIDHGEETKG